MQTFFVLAVKVLRRARDGVLKPIDWTISCFTFYSNNVQFSSFSNRGWPRINVARSGRCVIGDGFRSNNRESANPIGRFRPCSIVVADNGTLLIGRNVGMSSTAIVCHKRIEIGDNVLLGGNVVIYDTDFHSLDPIQRQNRPTDLLNAHAAPVRIGNNAFIGAHSTILKGVSIGECAVVGACSVVTRDVPANEIWAGNPARKVGSVTGRQ